jgi:hypothetical protein
MGCMFCGREIGPLRSLRDNEFCTTRHRKQYRERLSKALGQAEMAVLRSGSVAEFIVAFSPSLRPASARPDLEPLDWTEHNKTAAPHFPLVIDPVAGRRAKPIRFHPADRPFAPREVDRDTAPPVEPSLQRVAPALPLIASSAIAAQPNWTSALEIQPALGHTFVAGATEPSFAASAPRLPEWLSRKPEISLSLDPTAGSTAKLLSIQLADRLFEPYESDRGIAPPARPPLPAASTAIPEIPQPFVAAHTNWDNGFETQPARGVLVPARTQQPWFSFSDAGKLSALAGETACATETGAALSELLARQTASSAASACGRLFHSFSARSLPASRLSLDPAASAQPHRVQASDRRSAPCGADREIAPIAQPKWTAPVFPGIPDTTIAAKSSWGAGFATQPSLGSQRLARTEHPSFSYSALRLPASVTRQSNVPLTLCPTASAQPLPVHASDRPTAPRCTDREAAPAAQPQRYAPVFPGIPDAAFAAQTNWGAGFATQPSLGNRRLAPTEQPSFSNSTLRLPASVTRQSSVRLTLDPTASAQRLPVHASDCPSAPRCTDREAAPAAHPQRHALPLPGIPAAAIAAQTSWSTRFETRAALGNQRPASTEQPSFFPVTPSMPAALTRQSNAPLNTTAEVPAPIGGVCFSLPSPARGERLSGGGQAKAYPTSDEALTQQLSAPWITLDPAVGARPLPIQVCDRPASPQCVDREATRATQPQPYALVLPGIPYGAIAAQIDRTGPETQPSLSNQRPARTEQPSFSRSPLRLPASVTHQSNVPPAVDPASSAQPLPLRASDRPAAPQCTAQEAAPSTPQPNAPALLGIPNAAIAAQTNWGAVLETEPVAGNSTPALTTEPSFSAAAPRLPASLALGLNVPPALDPAASVKPLPLRRSDRPTAPKFTAQEAAPSTPQPNAPALPNIPNAAVAVQTNWGDSLEAEPATGDLSPADATQPSFSASAAALPSGLDLQPLADVDAAQPPPREAGIIPLEYFCARGTASPTEELEWTWRSPACSLQPLKLQPGGEKLETLAVANEPSAPFLPPVRKKLTKAEWRVLELTAAGILLAILAGLGLPFATRIGTETPDVKRDAAAVSTVTAKSGGPLAKVRHAIAARAALELSEPFRGSMDAWGQAKSWAPGWTHRAEGYVQTGQLALFKPSMEFTDYRMEFFGQIESKSIGWVVRARDRQNYYAMKFTVIQTGLRPIIAMVHYPVTGGHAGRPIETPLMDVMIHNDTPYHVAVAVHGNRIITSIEGQEVDRWIEDQIPAGGVGFYSDAGERARLYWMKISKNEDFLGKVCAYLSGSADASRTFALLSPPGWSASRFKQWEQKPLHIR